MLSDVMTVTDALVRKLRSVFSLSEEERAAVETLPVQIAEFGARHEIVREGQRPTRCFFILEGLTCLYQTTEKGNRQIVGVQVAGDIPDLQSLHLPLLDFNAATLSAVKLGFMPHSAVKDLCERYPRINNALWRSSLVDAAIFRAWVTNIGQRPAYSRTAHFLCEMIVRHAAVGKSDRRAIAFPVTQSELADALGLSIVQVNRSLQKLRTDGLIQLKDGVLKALDWNALRIAAEFEASYLHLRDPTVVD
jgi:CRP-like cAMP-binding protein